jgi:small GTP-binding protein
MNSTLKLILLGSPGVGKTALVSNFTERGPFAEESRSTIGVDFHSCSVAVGEDTVRLQIWDTAGQERFRALQAQYYRGSDAVMLVYDMTNPASLVALNGWAEEVRVACKDTPMVSIAGNKSDLVSTRKVSAAEAAEHGRVIGAAHVFEVSAKDSANVKQSFETLIADTWLAKKTSMKHVAACAESGSVLLQPPQTQHSVCCQV